MYGYEILTQHTFMEFPDFYLGEILIFSFLRPKTAILTIFCEGGTRKRQKKLKKGKKSKFRLDKSRGTQ